MHFIMVTVGPYSELLPLMRRCIISFFTGLLIISRTSAQNLVPDPGFENFISCPSNFTVTANPLQPLTNGWFIPTLGTSDYFHSCATGTPVFMPENFFGTQQAKEGNGYAGIFVFSNNNPNYREYIEAELTSPLVAGKTYDVGFYVSRSDSSDIYIKEIGARLSNILIVGSWTTNIGVVPQVKNTSGPLSDIINWIPVKGSYTATGGEQYIIIGTFNADATLDLSNFTTMQGDDVAYYYIDSVYVTECVSFNAGNDASMNICSEDDPVNLLDYLPGAEPDGYWLDPSGNDFGGVLDPSQEFSGTYKYIGGNGGCSDTSLLAVTIITNGSAGNDAQVNVCASTDLFAFLQGNPTAGGTWLDPSGNVFTNPLDPANDPAGMYTYIVNSSGCSDTSYIFAELNQPVIVSFTANPPAACLPLEITFNLEYTDQDMLSSLWDFGDGSTAAGIQVQHQYSDSGCYNITLQFTSIGGCTMDTVIADAVCVFPASVADFSFSPSPPSLDDPLIFFSNLSTAADSYHWQFGNIGSSSEANPSFSFPLQEGDYAICLVATNEFGCVDTLCKTISFSYGPSVLIVPNAFTPNGDGLNDEFRIYGKWFDRISLKIFNRWGNEVFQTTDWNEGWKGTYKGKPENQGVFTYYLEAYFLDGNHLKKEGVITLLR